MKVGRLPSSCFPYILNPTNCFRGIRAGLESQLKLTSVVVVDGKCEVRNTLHAYLKTLDFAKITAGAIRTT